MMLEGSEGLPEGSKGQLDGSESQPKGSETQQGRTDVQTDSRMNAQNFSTFYMTWGRCPKRTAIKASKWR